jgi:hypothetical protein
MKKQFSEIKIEIMLLDEEDVICASSDAGSKPKETTAAAETTVSPIDTADDLQWDTME